MPKLSNSTKKSFRLSVVILKRKIRPWNPTYIVINYCIIITNAYYIYIINAYYNFYYNKGLREKFDKEANLEVTGDWFYFLFEKKVVNRFVQCHVFANSRPGRRTGNKYPATFRTAPNFCKKTSLAVLFGGNHNKYEMSTQSVM